MEQNPASTEQVWRSGFSRLDVVELEPEPGLDFSLLVCYNNTVNTTDFWVS